MLITVFTPTYNRAYTLEKLYQSLLNQTNLSFEWVVVDDGSTDQTFQLFEHWLQKENPFNISYHKQENQGKHVAINRGLELANGEVFFIVDSDDEITENAIEKIITWSEKIISDQQFWGVSGNLIQPDGKAIGTSFTGQYKDLYYHERQQNNITGDKAEAFFMHQIKDFRFPVFENEKFLTESVLFLEFGERFKIRYYNEPIYVAEYLHDGLSKNITDILKKNPKGLAHLITKEIQVYKKGIKTQLSYFYYYYRDYKDILSFSEIRDNLKTSSVFLALAIMGFTILNFFRK